MSRNELKKVVVECLDEIGIILTPDAEEVNLLDEGVDSLEFINFILVLEEKLNLSIPDQFLLPEVLMSLNGFVELLTQLDNDRNMQ